MTEKNKQEIATDTGRRIDFSAVKTVRRKEKEHEPAPKKYVEPQKEEFIEFKEPQEPIKTNLVAEKVEFDESGDFSSMLLESELTNKNIRLAIGDKISAKVIHVGKEYAFVGLGPKLEAFIALSEFEEKPEINQNINAYIISLNSGVCLSKRVSQNNLDEEMLKDALANQIPIQGKIAGVNKGGYEIAIGSKRAFCPLGQIDDKFIQEPTNLIGHTYDFLIEKIEEAGRNIVVSRKRLLQKHSREQAALILDALEVGQTVNGIVTKTCDFGAFVDIGGIEGLIPKSELSYAHVDKVLDIVSSNDKVVVCILSLEKNLEEPHKTKISLSLKKAKEDPYKLHWHKLSPGLVMEGRVSRLENFGAFIELFEGIDGLIHISQLSEERIAHPKEVLNISDPVTVMILDVDQDQKRVSLSLRELVRKKRKDEQANSVASIERGQKATGTVSRIEKYGVFVELENGASALLPASEIGLPKFSDLSHHFKLGEKLDVVIIDVDKDNRVKVSALARKQMDERDTYLSFNSAQEKAGSFGTFADLLNKKK